MSDEVGLVSGFGNRREGREGGGESTRRVLKGNGVNISTVWIFVGNGGYRRRMRDGG